MGHNRHRRTRALPQAGVEHVLARLQREASYYDRLATRLHELGHPHAERAASCVNVEIVALMKAMEGVTKKGEPFQDPPPVDEVTPC